ncbi:hypothetical protein IID20_05260, partial [Patescibacteria group bacterium]|nr:hypothetical protein [Patescibacteria group bacterium]
MTEEINKKDSNFIPESTSGSIMEKPGNKELSDEYQRLINRGEEFTKEELIQRLEKLGVKPDDDLDQKRLVRLWAEKKFKEPKKIDWLRGKLQEFKQAREGLVTAEVNRKKFEGIKRVLNLGQGTKAGAEKEYENAKQEYDLKRAEYIGEHVGRKLKEQTKLADLRVEEFDKKKGWGRKFYEGYKKLGEWNVGKLLGEKVMGKLETDEGDSGIMRFAKGTGRFFTKSLSVRTALSFSMLGAGIYLGAAGAGGAALTAIAGRRVLSGIGAGFGSYDLMKMFGERKERKEGMRKELTEEEVKDLSLEEIMDRMDHFEIGAELNNQKVSENKTYTLFKQEFYVRARGGQIKQKIDELIKSTDQGITKIRVQEKTKERKRKIIASSIGTFIGSGGLAKVIDMGTDQLQDLYAG